MSLATKTVRVALRKLGYELVPAGSVSESSNFPPDFDVATQNVCNQVSPFSMTSPERLFALRQSVQYVVQHHIPGAIVECGVWKGGSMMAVAQTLLELNATDRDLYLFDTFDGMSQPTAEDSNLRGESAADLMAQAEKNSGWIWAYGGMEEVRNNLHSTLYPTERIHLIRGKVEDTIPGFTPAQIALLRLDTDWYTSTRHELVHLYPRLSAGGVLIVDDYGHWAGARKAVDEYLSEHGLKLLLHRIDYTGRICVKSV